MKLKHIAIIVTALVIIAGLAMISPLFLIDNDPETKPKAMLTFSIIESTDTIGWCQSLSTLLNDNNLAASVFIVGEVAKEYPKVISLFSNKVDIGSQTYNNLNLTDILDYSVKLQQVNEGKMAVDNAGNLYSCIFKAPFGATDQDIYSLLRRSGIVADFSYENQYNVYLDGQFVKFDAITYVAHNFPFDFFSTLSETSKPIIIYFDNNDQISDIEKIISNLKNADVECLNASELTGLNLTNRGVNLATNRIATN